MGIFFTKILLLISVLSAQAQDPKDEFAETESLLLNEVTLYECAPGKVPCEAGRSDIGCVPEGLSEQAFTKACSKFFEMKKEFNFDCYLKSASGKKVFFGQTKTEEACIAMQTVWEKISVEPTLSGRSDEWRLRFLKTTLLAPRKGGGRDNPVVDSNLDFKKNGRMKRISDKTERLMKKVYANLEDYQAEATCGSGIAPGMDQVPVLNQNRQGTCYAHVSSNLIDYVRKTRAGAEYPVFSSPLMGAIDYKINSTDEVTSCDNPMRGGDACQAFNAGINRGFCSSNQIEKAIIRSFKPQGGKKTSWYLDWAKKQNISMSMEEFKLKPNDHVMEYLHLIGKLYQEKNWKRLKELHGILKSNGMVSGEACTKNLVNLDSEFQIIQLSGDLENFYSNYFSAVCKREPFPFSASCRTHNTGINIANLDAELKKGYPIGISYCSGILTNSKFQSASKPIQNSDACGRHASLIVGTARDSKGRCTYVVRNSWGKSCNYGYDKSYDCKDGHIYIPKETLIKQVYRYQDISVK